MLANFLGISTDKNYLYICDFIFIATYYHTLSVSLQVNFIVVSGYFLKYALVVCYPNHFSFHNEENVFRIKMKKMLNLLALEHGSFAFRNCSILCASIVAFTCLPYFSV